MTEKERMVYYESHNENDYILIGDLELFEDHDSFVEKVIGNLNLKNKAKLLTIELFLREGWQKPHIHLYNDHFKCAIRLDTNEYFIHGNYKDKLNDKQAKLFDTFMRGSVDGPRFLSKWEYCIFTFNTEFPDHKIKIKEQSNYTMINYK